MSMIRRALAMVAAQVRCRICRRVTAATFLAVLLVEAVILIPSYDNYERDRLAQMNEVGLTASRGIVAAARQPNGVEDAVRTWLSLSPLVGCG